MESGIQGPCLSQTDVILGIEADLVAGLTGVALEVPGGIDLDLRVHDLLVHVGERLRDESVVGITPAKMDPMRRSGIVFKVSFQHPVPHAGAVIETIEIPVGESFPYGFLAQHFRLHHHAVPIVSQGGVAEELPGKDMVPPQSGHCISPADAQFALVEALYGRSQSVVLGFLMSVIQVIHSVVHIEIQAVPVIEAMGDLGIQVVEEIVSVELDSFEDRRQEQGVHAPGADGIGSASFPKRTFQVELVRQHADAEVPVRFIQVAVVGADIDDAGDTTAVAGREGTLVQGHFLNGFRLEDGEDAQQVFRIINGNPVQQEQVLVRSAAPDIDAGEALRPALDTGQELERFDDIGLAEKGRSRLEDLQRNLDGAHLGRCDAGFLLRSDDSLFQGSAGNQLHMDSPVALRGDGDRLRGIPHIGIGDFDLLFFRNRQGVETEIIGDGSVPADGRSSPDERLARGGIRDQTADRHFPYLRENHMVPIDLIADVRSLEKAIQRLLERGPIGLYRFPLQRQGGVIHEMDAILLLQGSHPLAQRRLRPKARRDQQEDDRRQRFSYHIHFQTFPLVDKPDLRPHGEIGPLF